MASKSKKHLKDNRRAQLKAFFGKILVFTGVLIIAIVLILTNLPQIIPEKSQVFLPKVSQNTDIFPQTIQIPGSLSKISVQKGRFLNGQWELSDNSALFLTSSGIPGQKGNIVIYGHNTNNIFGKLAQTKVNDLIEIQTNNNQTLHFKVDTVKSVLPTTVEILKQGEDQRITLYTCTGILDSMRLVVSGQRV